MRQCTCAAYSHSPCLLAAYNWLQHRLFVTFCMAFAAVDIGCQGYSAIFSPWTEILYSMYYEFCPQTAAYAQLIDWWGAIATLRHMTNSDQKLYGDSLPDQEWNDHITETKSVIFVKNPHTHICRWHVVLCLCLLVGVFSGFGPRGRFVYRTEGDMMIVVYQWSNCAIDKL